MEGAIAIIVVCLIYIISKTVFSEEKSLAKEKKALSPEKRPLAREAQFLVGAREVSGYERSKAKDYTTSKKQFTAKRALEKPLTGSRETSGYLGTNKRQSSVMRASKKPLVGSKESSDYELSDLLDDEQQSTAKRALKKPLVGSKETSGYKNPDLVTDNQQSTAKPALRKPTVGSKETSGYDRSNLVTNNQLSTAKPANRVAKAITSKEKPSVGSKETSGYTHSDLDTNNQQSSDNRASWYGANQRVSVHDYNITGGMVYVGETLPDVSGYIDDACLINPTLNALPAEPWECDDDIDEWPQYRNISPRCRGAYLKWLADGRSEPKVNIAYVFLFFYGLERRLFVDGQKGALSAKERGEIVQEARRLLSIYGANSSFCGYVNNFLAVEWALYRNNVPVPDYIDFGNKYCSETFQFILAMHVSEGEPIPAVMAYQWSIFHPEIYLETTALRCPKEFKELFCQRYQDGFGDGLIVKPNKTGLEFGYSAANPSLKVKKIELTFSSLPTPFLLTEPQKTLTALVEACTVDLDAYCQFLAQGNDPNTFAAIALLPKELLLQSPVTQKNQAQLAQVCANGPGLMSVESLYKCFDAQAPLKINKKDSETLAALVEGIGFGIAPDSRYHHVNPSSGGKIALFSNGHGADFRPSKEYGTLVTLLRLGAMVSQSDDDIAPAEQTLLQSLVHENQNLTRVEKDSLSAFLQWCLHTPQGTLGIKQRLGEISKAGRIAIGHKLISVAYADGIIDPREVTQLEKLYSTLGLNKEQVTSDLHTLATASTLKPNEDVTKPKGFSLNEELIRIGTEETRKVKDLLEDVFADPEEKEEELVEHDSNAVDPLDSPLGKLDKEHQDLFHRLIQQERWERRALQELCKELGLMLDGAMEDLNEWFIDNANAQINEYGDGIIEGEDPIFVNVTLAREIIDG